MLRYQTLAWRELLVLTNLKDVPIESLVHLVICHQSTLCMAWKLWMDGKPLDLVDPVLGDSIYKSEVTRCIQMALLCVQENLDERPTMANVIRLLYSSSLTLPIPHQPEFFLHGQMTPMSNLPEPMICSANGVSITELYPR
ncbi:hypothetical protein LIER_32587 [Lithospermum erythrorhizon]|uniref:S-locus receptor kinase C-terminal domain-containing protein n=1 Tax=Lithospermum erythrorhizon TaxID=34254 RepID=A0AAV3RXX1_LITER